MANREEYTEALIALLPKGPAWDVVEGSILYNLLHAFAAELERLDQHGQAMIKDCNPLYVVDQLAAREIEAGLPYECLAPTDNIELRRKYLIIKWASIGGASKGYFENLARQVFDRDLTIEEYKPYTCVDTCFEPVYDDRWAYVWQVTQELDINARYFRSGTSTTGEPLLTWDADPLPCIFNDHKPAHTTILFRYITNILRYSDRIAANVWQKSGAISVASDTPIKPKYWTNPYWEGAVAGTPGTAPNNVTMTSSGSGLTRTISAVSAGGMNVRWAGTTTGAVSPVIFRQSPSVPTAQGQSWQWRMGLQLISGTLPSGGLMLMRMYERDSGGVTISGTFSSVDLQTLVTSAPQTIIRSRVVTSPLAASLTCDCVITYPTATSTAFTLKLSEPSILNVTTIGPAITDIITTSAEGNWNITQKVNRPVRAATRYAGSVYVQADASATPFYVEVGDATSTSQQTFTINTSIQRVEVFYDTTVDSEEVFLRFGQVSAKAGYSVGILGTQLEKGTEISPYIRTD